MNQDPADVAIEEADNEVQSEDEATQVRNNPDTAGTNPASPLTSASNDELTPNDKSHRFLAFENRIGPTPHTTKDLLSILKAVDWDVDHSEALFHHWQADRRSRRSWGDHLKAGSEEGETTNVPQSPDYEPSTEDVLGPTYIGGYTIDEHLSSLSDVSVDLPGKLMGATFAWSGNADYERREAVCTFADIVLQRYDILLSRSEAALALGFAKWNLERAVDYYHNDDSVETTRAALSTFFDRMQLLATRHQDAKDVQSERDIRLALLLTYTGYPSWYSGQLHLTKYGDDLVKAIAGWLRDGIEPITHKSDKPGKRGEGYGRRLDFDGQRVALPEAKDTFRKLKFDDEGNWAVEPQAFMSDEKKANIDVSPLQKTSSGSWKFPVFGKMKKVVRDKKGNLKIRQAGGVINYDVEPPRIGAPDWTKFRFEYISNGKYYNVPWSNKQLLAERGENRTVAEGGTRHADDERTEVFDWNDKKMIENLRKWLSQKMGRATQVNLREAGQRLSVEEKQYLKQLVDDAFVHHKLRYPDRNDTELKRTFTISNGTKDGWENKWNARFASKTVPSEMNPRRTRHAVNLYNLAKRWKKLCDLYGMTFDTHGNATDTNEDKWPWEVEVQAEAEIETEDESGDEE